jgi:hypothetical protein
MTAQLHRRSFIWSMWFCTLLTMNIGMTLMSVGIILGLPIFVSVFLFLGGIYLGIGILAGDAIYTVSETGLRQQIGPMSWFKWVDKKIDRQFTWKDIQWVQMGTDVNRSFSEYHYLKIKLYRRPYRLQISSDQTDINEYNNFISVFNQLSGNEDEGPRTSSEKLITPSQLSDEEITKSRIASKIKVKPDFYSTIKAKILFYLFCLLLIGLIGLIVSTGIFKMTYALRFLIIIVPGMGYYYWRLFVKK